MAGSKTKEPETNVPVVPPSNGEQPPATPTPTKDLFASRKSANKAKFDINKLEVKKTLTKQLFSIAHSKSLVIKVTSEIYDQKMPMAGRGKSEETDTKLVDMIDLATGEEGALICNALIVKAFENAGGTLAGRMFAIREGGIKEGKKYRSIDMVELAE